MPFILVRTNLELDKTAKDTAAANLSALAAQALSKPESFVMAGIGSNLSMSFGGSLDPCAHVVLESIGLPESVCTSLSREICELIEEELGIPPERVYIRFTDLERSRYGWNSKTFG